MLTACRFMMTLYTIIQACQVLLIYGLSPDIETFTKTEISQMPTNACIGLEKSKWTVVKLSLLFMIDSFGGSFVLQSIVSGWFFHIYGTPTSKIGTMIFVCNIFAGVSALFAAKLADSIGLVLTMVVTHLPSNVFIILVPLMPNETWAIAMLCLRYSISQMDVPTRNAYVQGVVDPTERSAANGVTNVVRSIGGSVGPYCAGLLYSNPKYVDYPFFVAGSLKIIYDLLLLYSFTSLKPQHEIDAEKKYLKDNSSKEIEMAAVNNDEEDQ